jgi:hypothetical protein
VLAFLGVRSALLLVLLAGCPLTASNPPACQDDADCGDEVCARDEQCYPADDVRAVTVTWTVNGAPASEATCADSPSLYIQFLQSSDGRQLDFTPVPCELGRFFVDKLPRAFDSVELGELGGSRFDRAGLGASGAAALDLGF